MKIYSTHTILREYERPEKQVFCGFIKEIRYWERTNELDLLKQSESPGCLTRFNTLPTGLFSDDLDKLIADIMELSVEEFWDKYEDNLTGIWHKGLKVIL